MRDELDSAGDNLDVHRLALGLARSARWIVAILLVGLAIGLAYGVGKPNGYVSEGKIQVRLGMRERRSPESSLGPDSEVPPPTPGIGDEIELLCNPEVYRRIAREIGPELLLAPYDPAANDGPDTALPLRWFHRCQSWWFRLGAVEGLAPEAALKMAAAVADKAIVVTALQGTSYLVVDSTFHSPELAQRLTQTYLVTARQWHREVYSPEVQLTFVSDQLQRYEAESLAAEQSYTEHRKQCGLFDLEAQRQGFVKVIEEDDTRIQADTIRLFEIEDELAFVEKELEATPRTINKLIPPSLKANAAYTTALAQLQKLTGDRRSLASVYTEDSEIYRRKAAQIDTEIRELQGSLAEIPEFVEYGATTREEVPNPRHEELSFRRVDLAQEKETRAKTVDLWKRSKAEQEERLRAALQCEPLHRDFSRAVERARARVQEVSAALERAQALALLDRQEDLDSLRIAQEGAHPWTKLGPDRKRFLMLGFFGGLATALFLAVLRFLLDPRIHEPEALEKDLELRVIGVIPDARAWRRAGAGLRRQNRISART